MRLCAHIYFFPFTVKGWAGVIWNECDHILSSFLCNAKWFRVYWGDLKEKINAYMYLLFYGRTFMIFEWRYRVNHEGNHLKTTNTYKHFGKLVFCSLRLVQIDLLENYATYMDFYASESHWPKRLLSLENCFLNKRRSLNGIIDVSVFHWDCYDDFSPLGGIIRR